MQRIRESASLITWLREEQIEQQLLVLEDYPTLQTMVATYICAGLRREEALWLTIDDVDLDQKLIHVCAKNIDGEFWQPKTKRNRVIPISSALLGIMHSPNKSTSD